MVRTLKLDRQGEIPLFYYGMLLVVVIILGVVAFMPVNLSINIQNPGQSYHVVKVFSGSDVVYEKALSPGNSVVESRVSVSNKAMVSVQLDGTWIANQAGGITQQISRFGMGNLTIVIPLDSSLSTWTLG